MLLQRYLFIDYFLVGHDAVNSGVKLQSLQVSQLILSSVGFNEISVNFHQTTRSHIS